MVERDSPNYHLLGKEALSVIAAMAAIQAEIKRGVLRSLYRMSKQGNPATLTPAGATVGSSLATFLDAFQDQNFAAVQSGRFIIATAGVGRSSTFQTPQIWQSFTPEQIFSLAEELEAVYADAKTTLATAGNNSPTDDQIFNVMMDDDRLQTITWTQKDYSTLRWPTRL